MKSFPYSVKCPLYAKYPEIGVELIEFMQFARSQIFPVSLSILQERTRMAAESRSIIAFRVLNYCVQRFLRLNPIQKSIRMH